jgi:MFS family permease
VWGKLPLLFVGLFLFGGGSAANLQARYAAVDLAEPARRGRQLSFVVWATTIGSVTGPNLAFVADQSLRRFGAAEDSGPFFFSAIAFALAGVLVLVALRPDPLLTARALAAASPAATDRTDAEAARGMRAAAREISAAPGARLGLAAMVVGHVVMVSVMSMTPVHIAGPGHPDADALRIVGFVISVHIAGMYALSPVTGWLTDRLGRRPVILGGIALLLSACAVAGLSGHDTRGLVVGLGLLGLGWSATMVAGSTLLSESVQFGNRASVQGLSDSVMGMGGAVAAALAGLVVGWSSYAVLTMIAAVVTIPLLAATLRPVRLGSAG